MKDADQAFACRSKLFEPTNQSILFGSLQKNSSQRVAWFTNLPRSRHIAAKARRKLFGQFMPLGREIHFLSQSSLALANRECAAKINSSLYFHVVGLWKVAPIEVTWLRTGMKMPSASLGF